MICGFRAILAYSDSDIIRGIFLKKSFDTLKIKSYVHSS